MDFKLELVFVPVSDVDRAKAFYADQVGFVVDHDHQVNDDLRFVQLTPPGSASARQRVGHATDPGLAFHANLVLVAERGAIEVCLRDQNACVSALTSVHSAGGRRLSSPLPPWRRESPRLSTWRPSSTWVLSPADRSMAEYRSPPARRGW